MGGLLFGWVDPSRDRQLWGLRAIALKSLWIGGEGGIQGIGTVVEQRLCLAMMDGCRRHEADA